MLEKIKQNLWPVIGLLGILFLLLGGYVTDFKIKPLSGVSKVPVDSSDQGDLDFKALDEVLPKEVIIPVSWNNLGKQMTEAGVIDKDKFEKLYESRGGLTEEQKNILYGDNNNYIKITQENSGFWLNVLWGFGLANNNEVLTKGPMTQNGLVYNFASTGGWTLSANNAMNHYSKHDFVVLNEEQQQKVVNVSKGIYRPCCSNPTYFPDCNHGMAMLGLLEILAANNFSETEMYQTALTVNSYWFPDTYLNIAKYFKEKRNLDWNQVDAEEALGITFSSGAGYSKILQEIKPVELNSGGGCGV